MASVHGLAVDEVVSEGAGRSAYSGKARPAWERLLREAPSGVVVLAVETSRLSRSASDGLAELKALRRRGVHVLTLDGTDTRQSASTLGAGIRLLFAEEESALKSERITRRKAAQKASGIWTNRPPFGHERTVSGRLALHPVTAPVVRRMVDEALAGSGAAAIARGLNADGIAGPNGAEWKQMTVSALLRNPVLCGLYPVGPDHRPMLAEDGQPVSAVEGPTVCTAAEWRRLQAVTSARAPRLNGARGGGGRPSSALLRGLAFCGRCGGRMAPVGPQYVCAAAREGRSCDGLTVLATKLDPAAEDAALRSLRAMDPSNADDLERLAAAALAWMGGPVERPEVAEAAHALAEVEEALARLEDAYIVRGTMARDRYEAMAATLTARREALTALVGERRPMTDLAPLLDAVESVQVWQATDATVRRSVLAAAGLRVTVAPAPYRGARFDADRVVIAWSDLGAPAA
jgi:DNA invertase Pin-like site-specific DNA recombinase